MAHEEASREEGFTELRWYLVREAYWDLEGISKKPAELHARWLELVGAAEGDPEYAGIDEIDDDDDEDEDEDDGEEEEEGEGEVEGEVEGEDYDGDEK
jgi:hypothetical protein